MCAPGRLALLEAGARADLLKTAKAKIRSGCFSAICIELCCEKDSALSHGVISGVLAIRITADCDLTLKQTRKALHGAVREAYLTGCAVYIWVSTPCTTGSPWQRVNTAVGHNCGDHELSDKLIVAANVLCRHAVRHGGWIFWEWPSTSSLWGRPDIIEFTQQIGASSRDVSTASLGMKFAIKREGSEVECYLKKKWRIFSNHVEFLQLLDSHGQPPDLPDDRFIECRGKVAKDSANYTPELAALFWSTVRVVPNPDHCDADIGAEPPLWSCFVTRKINLKSAEARSEAAVEAIDKELAGHRERQTWSETEVREYKDLMRDPSIPEVMLGRVSASWERKMLNPRTLLSSAGRFPGESGEDQDRV